MLINIFKKEKRKKMVKEFKKELSKLSGVDFFNPKYRDLFKRYFEDDSENEIEAMEDEVPEVAEIKEQDTDLDKAEDEREIDKIEEEKAETPAVEEEKKEEVAEESEQIAKDIKADEEEPKENDIEKQLIDTKIELELVRSNIRADKIAPAMRVIKAEIGGVEDLDKINDILKDFPEWKEQPQEVKNVGMPVDESGDGLSEEEKRLKQILG